MKLVPRLLCLVALLSTAANHNVRAEESESMIEETPIGQSSLRRQRPGNQRRLFYWGNLLYTLRVCNNYDGSGWCPAPHCNVHGPLKPPGCHNNQGGGSSSSSGGSSSSSSSSSGADGNADYTDYQYNEDEVNEVQAAEYEEEADLEYETDEGDAVDYNIEDGNGVESSTSVKRHFSAFWMVAGGAAVASLIGVFLMKKNRRNSDEDDVDHKLSQSVSKRLEKLLEGKSVPPIHDDAVGPAFVGLGKDASSSRAALSLPKPKNLYEEPDEEAIEMKLDDSARSKYVKM